MCVGAFEMDFASEGRRRQPVKLAWARTFERVRDRKAVEGTYDRDQHRRLRRGCGRRFVSTGCTFE